MEVGAHEAMDQQRAEVRPHGGAEEVGPHGGPDEVEPHGPRPRAGQPEIHEAAGVAMAASPGIHLL